MFKNNLVGPAKRFIVGNNSTDTTFGPGSIGFISHVLGSDDGGGDSYPNLLYVAASIIRRGKTGKERLESAELCVPMFDSAEGELDKLMPAEAERKKRKNLLRIEQLPDTEVLLIQDMEDIEFLGWIHSIALFLNKIFNNTVKVKNFSQDQRDFLAKLVGLPSRFSHDPSQTKDEFCIAENRLAVVEKLRLIEPAFSRCVARYRRLVAVLQVTAAMHIIDRDVKHEVLTKAVSEGEKTVAILETIQ